MKAEAAEEMGLARNTQTEKYIKKMDAKQEQDFRRKSQRDLKRSEETIKNLSPKKHTFALHEGVTYKSGIGFRQSAEGKAIISNGTLNDHKGSLTQEEFNNNMGEIVKPKELGPGPMAADREAEESYVFLVSDIKMTGLDRDSEMIQIACKSEGSSTSFSKYLLPDKRLITDSAKKVHSIRVEYRNGTKVLVKEEALPQYDGLTEFCSFVAGEESDDRKFVLVAHNRNRFDYQVLFNTLK